MTRRVFIFEVSGPTINFIRSYADHLPTIKFFLDNGAWSRLIGPLQPVLPTSFGTLLSGKNPGKTGLFDSFQFRAGSYERIPFSSDSLGFETLYQHLSRAGIQVGLLAHVAQGDADAVYRPQDVAGGQEGSGGSLEGGDGLSGAGAE